MSDSEDSIDISDVVADYNKFDIESVPPEEIPIEKKHPGRPDLDYDETVVGPAPTGDEGGEEE